MTELVVVCGGRQVDDHLRPVGQRCGRRFRAPGLVARDGWTVAHPLSDAWRPPTAGDVVERARAGGWAVPDPEEGAGGRLELVGTCPSCRRPAAEVTELTKERGKARST